MNAVRAIMNINRLIGIMKENIFMRTIMIEQEL